MAAPDAIVVSKYVGEAIVAGIHLTIRMQDYRPIDLGDKHLVRVELKQLSLEGTQYRDLSGNWEK